MVRRLLKRALPSLHELLPLLNRYRGRLALGFLWLVLTNALATAIPWILKTGVDAFREEQTRQVLLLCAGAMVGVSAVAGGFRFLMRRTLIGASREMEFDLRNRFFSHLESLSQDFFLKKPTGDLMAQATNDLSAVRDVLGPGLMYFPNGLISVLFALVLMMQIDPFLTAMSLIPFPILALGTNRFAHALHQRSRAVQEQFGVMSNFLQEDLSGIRVIKSYTQERHEEEHFFSLNKDYVAKNLALIRARAVFFATMAFLVGGGLLILLWLGGARVASGRLSLGGFIAFNGYIALLTWPFIALGWVMAMIQRGEAAMGRLLETLESRSSIQEPATPRDPEQGLGEIVFENVSLTYPGAALPSLEEVSLTIPAGTTVAIVGRTGSGKSSVVRLAVRLFDPTEGRVLLDGIDLREWSLGGLRENVGLVLQESFMWSDTLAANLRFAKPDATDDDLERVARISRLDKDLPQFIKGWETRVGERGVTLSGGQRQRAALARALLRGTPVLILDDTLSSLDNVTQEEVLSSMANAEESRTVIIISHRISTIRRAEKIFVLDRGRLVEEGTHNELMALKGAYARIARRQTILQELETMEAPGEITEGA
jgi:ATP-binding cassette subfamily B protein